MTVLQRTHEEKKRWKKSSVTAAIKSYREELLQLIIRQMRDAFITSSDQNMRGIEEKRVREID